MRRRLTKAASTLVTAVLLTAGGAFLAATPAQAEPARQTQVQVPAGVWVNYKNYSTYEACRQQGREMLGAGVVIDWECNWDSPYWLLRVRIE